MNREDLLGGADTVMCAGEASLSDLVDLCLTNARPPNKIRKLPRELRDRLPKQKPFVIARGAPDPYPV